MRRPMTDGDRGSYCTTPLSADTMSLLGAGLSHEGVTISSDEKRALDRLYGFVPETPRERPPPPVEPKREEFPVGFDGNLQFENARRTHKTRYAAWEKWKDPRPFYQAGANRSVMRHAATDGLRLIAWLAKHLEPGADPLKTLVCLASADGWDVDPQDVEWAQGAEESEEE